MKMVNIDIFLQYENVSLYHPWGQHSRCLLRNFGRSVGDSSKLVLLRPQLRDYNRLGTVGRCCPSGGRRCRRENSGCDLASEARNVESFKVKTDTELDCILNPTLFSVYIQNFMEGQSNMQYYTFIAVVFLSHGIESSGYENKKQANIQRSSSIQVRW